MSMTITWSLGELLAKARKDAGLEQAALAERVGIARNSLSNYETGRSVPPFDVAARIAAVCGVSLEWLASALNEEAPAEAGAVVRPKGFEPPTFWSVVTGASNLESALDLILWDAELEAVRS